MKSINGWSNNPTWYAYLWLTNDEDTYHEAVDTVADAADPAGALYELVSERAPVGQGLYSDLLLWALAVVNWNELAGAFAEVAA